MLERVTEGPERRIAVLVKEVLAKRGVEEAIPADADLGRRGMTSVDMVELMLGVEAEFDVAIPPEEITLANFSSIAQIAAMVRRLPSAS